MNSTEGGGFSVQPLRTTAGGPGGSCSLRLRWVCSAPPPLRSVRPSVRPSRERGRGRAALSGMEDSAQLRQWYVIYSAYYFVE